MFEPADIQQLTVATLSAGAIVLFGACYAVFLALSRLNGMRNWRIASHFAFAALVVATAVMTWALALEGGWLVLIAVLLCGYYATPRLIWHLSVATHEPADSSTEGNSDDRSA